MDKLFIVVEGVADETFLSQLIEAKVNSSFEIEFIKVETNGASIKQKRVDQILAKTTNLAEKTIFILDADAPTYIETRDSLIENFRNENLGISQESIFLLPNNQDDGCLEDLLIQIVSDKAEPIFRCFESYKECINGVNPNYTKPDIKTKVYAYSEITTKSGNERNRDYTNREVWNLEYRALNPLVKFLNQHLS